MLTIDRSHRKIGSNENYDLLIDEADRTQCQKLSLRRNYISNADDILNGFTSLVWLCLSANNLTKVPSCLVELPTLEHLFICNNQITEISNVGNCLRLKTLELRHNAIKEVSDLSSLQSLTTLTLSCNKITELPTSHFPKSLQFLGLYGNKLTAFEQVVNIVSVLQNLRKIFIGSNPFCNNLPLKHSLKTFVEYRELSSGVKRLKMEEECLSIDRVIEILNAKCPSLISVDNNEICL